MAGEGEFAAIREEKGKEEQVIILQSEGDGMQRKCVRILYLE
jgi:hypothetical protein